MGLPSFKLVMEKPQPIFFSTCKIATKSHQTQTRKKLAVTDNAAVTDV